MRGPITTFAGQGARRFGRFVLVFAATSCLLPTAVDAYVRDETVDENYEWGYFTWSTSSGKGGLAWDSAAPTDDPGGPPEPSDSVERTKHPLMGGATYTSFVVPVTTNLRAALGDNPLLPPPTDFVSEPLPRTLYVNASRLVRVDLMIKGCASYSSTNDPQFSIELRLGDRFFAGAQYSSPILYGGIIYYAPAPKVPAGYCFRSFRMPAEIDILPAGAVLTLRVVPESQTQWHQFGTAKDHRSILQIPFLPPEEAIFRFPELASAGAAGDGSAESDMGPVGLVAALAVAGGLTARRPRLLTALMFLVAPFAGCLGAGEDPSGSDEPRRLGGSAKSTILDDETNSTGLANGSVGTLAGTVHDDLGIPIPNAHVSLRGTEWFADTNRAGQFTLVGLDAGTYDLRVDSLGYRTFEGPVTVAAGRITRLEITMESRDNATVDFKPHRHDRWEGKDRLVILQRTYDLTAKTDFGLRFVLPADKTILPGTRELEVVVTWPMSWLDRVAFAFTGPHEKPSGGGYSVNETIAYPREKGKPFRIQVGPEMADPGHHQTSTWRSLAFRPAIWAANHANQAQRLVENTQYTVTITLIKGLVPFEPAHTDVWEGAESLVLSADQGWECCSYSGQSGWRPRQPVPPETTWLEVIHNQTKQTLQNHGLKYRSANMSESTPDTNYRPMSPKIEAPLHKVYHLRIEPREADPFYAGKTNWFFIPRFPNDPANNAYQYADAASDPLTSFVVTVTIVAHRGALP